MAQQHLNILQSALEAHRFEITKRENDQEYGDLQWVSEIWTVGRIYDGWTIELRFKGMADDALTTLPVEEADSVEAYSPSGNRIAELGFGNLSAQSKWKAEVGAFLHSLTKGEDIHS